MQIILGSVVILLDPGAGNGMIACLRQDWFVIVICINEAHKTFLENRALTEIQTHLAEHYASSSLKVKMKNMDVSIKEIYKQEALPKMQSALHFGGNLDDEDDDDDGEPPRKKAKVQEDDDKKEKKEKGDDKKEKKKKKRKKEKKEKKEKKSGSSGSSSSSD